MKRIHSLSLASLLALAGVPLTLLLGACSVPSSSSSEAADEHVDSADSALTAQQCNYFAVNGKVQICHRTGSAAHPYTVTKVSEQACINAHALHAGDYVAVNDPTCQGGGCLPQGAPCDATLPCCDGFSCTAGTCTPNVADHCSPSACQNGSTCTSDASGYTCNCLAGYTGTNCETETNECAPAPCANGTCLDGINSYVCECAAGWEGANCDQNINDCVGDPCGGGGACIDQVGGYTCDCAPGYVEIGGYCYDIDECESHPCANNGVCNDLINAYSCTCDLGWTGTNCDQPTAPATCPCSGDPWWIAALTDPQRTCYGDTFVMGQINAAFPNGGACYSTQGFDEYGDADISTATFHLTNGEEDAACRAEIAAACSAPPPPPVTCPCAPAWDQSLSEMSSTISAGYAQCVYDQDDAAWSLNAQYPMNTYPGLKQSACTVFDAINEEWVLYLGTTAEEHAVCLTQFMTSCGTP